ncbi:Oidioi.mRNA.OKI2018_I69.chr2.g5426.t1.cds [Oikopleura dioica]|uniref:Oidioi.mRNA.OKI2018_I69.chr2.g5426.t1.cds n=1 Tax=Oikopleura dioica TaxID=34765 RepID=A0ABN7SZV2_OIKDI|nr:Oidioi.mRNA.OKI2018_I69.chr2.g5426.t1.cds [Oikopleura dioica]
MSLEINDISCIPQSKGSDQPDPIYSGTTLKRLPGRFIDSPGKPDAHGYLLKSNTPKQQEGGPSADSAGLGSISSNDGPLDWKWTAKDVAHFDAYEREGANRTRYFNSIKFDLTKFE